MENQIAIIFIDEWHNINPQDPKITLPPGSPYVNEG
jgi:hypothetical protein